MAFFWREQGLARRMFGKPDFALLTPSEKRRITLLRQSLLAWAADHGAHYPWREADASDYERIVVEVLLQRTKRETVAKVYAGFLERFPSWSALADAHEVEIGEVLQPLGLWRRRAASLKALARYAASMGGRFPKKAEDLADVPAVGQYVANAIMLFQHGQARPLIDGNIARLLERVVRPRALADIRHDPWLQSAAFWLVRELPVETNWAALDFAGAVCSVRNPRCETCELSKRCRFGKQRASRLAIR